MLVTWEVDDATRVEAKFPSFGRKVRVKVNGRDVEATSDPRSKGTVSFAIDAARRAEIQVKRPFVGQPEFSLLVDGRLYAQTPKKPLHCDRCKAAIKPNDQYCDGCGHALPSAEARAQGKKVEEATSTIRALGFLFSIFGVAMFFVTRAQGSDALQQLASMGPSDPWPVPVNGVQYTVGELQQQIAWEPWGVLIVNAILAAVMFGLAMWGKRAPLQAILVATATYLVVIVTNAIIDPATIAQGMIMKILVLAFLFKGIQAALSLRSAHA